MSMQVGGSGGVRPLGPPSQQPQVQQPGAKTDPQVQQGTGSTNAGPVLHSINNFSSQPVSTDLQHLQQWLNKLKGIEEPAPKPLPQPAPKAEPKTNHKPEVPPEQHLSQRLPPDILQRPVSAQEVGFKKPDNQQTITETSKPAAPETPPVEVTTPVEEPAVIEELEEPTPPTLSDKQKKLLNVGLDRLSEKLDIKKSDLARLTYAKASENGPQFFFQLGKLDIPPSSNKGKLLTAGLDKLFSAVNAPEEAIADGVTQTLVLDDVARLAKAADIPASLVVDLGALTHNEIGRFKELAQAVGIPGDKAAKLLKGFEALAQQYDLDPQAFDQMMDDASRAINITVAKRMESAAAKLGLEPAVFNDMASAALTKNTARFVEVGKQAGLNRQQIQDVLPKVTRALAEVQAGPLITNEKVLRFTKDAAVQQMIADAGKEYGLSGDQSMNLAAAFVDDGLEGFVSVAKEYNLGRNSSELLNKFEAIEQQQGKGALSLSTNNIDDIAIQRRIVKDLKLQTNPIEWGTVSKPAPAKPAPARPSPTRPSPKHQGLHQQALRQQGLHQQALHQQALRQQNLQVPALLSFSNQ